MLAKGVLDWIVGAGGGFEVEWFEELGFVSGCGALPMQCACEVELREAMAGEMLAMAMFLAVLDGALSLRKEAFSFLNVAFRA